jgi:hypothetical protein
LLNNVVGIIGAMAMGCSKYLESYELLIMGRFLIGVNCGTILKLFYYNNTLFINVVELGFVSYDCEMRICCRLVFLVVSCYHSSICC